MVNEQNVKPNVTIVTNTTINAAQSTAGNNLVAIANAPSEITQAIQKNMMSADKVAVQNANSRKNVRDI